MDTHYKNFKQMIKLVLGTVILIVTYIAYLIFKDTNEKKKQDGLYKSNPKKFKKENAKPKANTTVSKNKTPNKRRSISSKKKALKNKN